MLHEKAEIPIPQELKNIQEWFGSIISRPLLKNDQINPISPSGLIITKEATKFISPSPTLKPHQRMQIYNQQYWWRLLDALQTNFPLVTRLFGPTDFNQKIAIPFMVKYPPDHWSLTLFGEKLPGWIDKYYHASDKKLVYDAALLDQIFASSFLGKQNPLLDLETLSKNDPEALLNLPFYLQPHLFLVQFDYDLPFLREEMLKEEPQYWMKHDFPRLPSEKIYHFVFFRNSKNNVAWKDISQEEFFLLKRFQEGASIQLACNWIEEQAEELQESMGMGLQQWIQGWARFGWLTASHPISQK